MDQVSRYYEVISWWFDAPIIQWVNYSPGLTIYGEAKLIYDMSPDHYSLDNKYFEARLQREIEQFVFIA
jgi:hypothetical protein